MRVPDHQHGDAERDNETNTEIQHAARVPQFRSRTGRALIGRYRLESEQDGQPCVDAVLLSDCFGQWRVLSVEKRGRNFRLRSIDHEDVVRVVEIVALDQGIGCDELLLAPTISMVRIVSPVWRGCCTSMTARLRTRPSIIFPSAAVSTGFHAVVA